MNTSMLSQGERHGRLRSAAERLRSFFAKCQAEEAAVQKRGISRSSLVTHPASGRSFRMLDEARRRRERGQDVVVGAIQPQVPPKLQNLLRNAGGHSAQGGWPGHRHRRGGADSAATLPSVSSMVSLMTIRRAFGTPRAGRM